MPGTYPVQRRSNAGDTYTGRSIRPYSVPSYIGRPTPSNDNTAGRGRPRAVAKIDEGRADEIGNDSKRSKRRATRQRQLIGEVFRGVPRSLNKYAALSLQIGAVVNGVAGWFANPIGFTHPGHIAFNACGGPPEWRGPLATSGCLILQAIGGVRREIFAAYDAGDAALGFSDYWLNMPLIDRYANVISYGVPSGSYMPPFPQAMPYPATNWPLNLPAQPAAGWAGRFAWPVMPPAIVPEFLLPKAPMPTPWAIPHGLVPYYRPPGAVFNPTHGSMRGNAVPARSPSWAPWLAPAFPPGGAAPPVVAPPGPGVVVVPGRYGGWGRLNGPVRWAPPPKGTKQKKIAVAGAASPIARIVLNIGRVTEGLDALDAIYQALPEGLRKRQQAMRHGKDPSPTGKLELLFNNLGKLDGKQAIENLINEQIQDTAIAKANRVGKLTNQAYGGDGRQSSPTRLGDGPQVGPNVWGDLKIDVW